MVLGNFDFGSVSSLFSDNYTVILSSVGGVIVLVIVFYIFGGGSSRFGSWRERRNIRRLGYSPIDVEGHTGRGILRELTSAVKNSIKTRILAIRAARQSSKMGRDFGKSAGALIGGEERNLEGAIHQMGLAATTKELAAVILKLVNASIRDDQAKKAIEAKLEELDARLTNMPIEEVNDAVRDFITAMGLQITSANIELSNNQDLVLNIRKKAFAEAYDALKDARKAEKLAKRIENRAIKNQAALKKFTEVDAKDIQDYLIKQGRQAKQRIRELQKSYSGTADPATRKDLIKQIQLTIALEKQTSQNINYLFQILEQLKAANIRMIQALESAYNDIIFALKLISDALAKENELRISEKGIDRQASALKSATYVAEANFKSIQNKGPEEIIIILTTDTANIYNSLIQISRNILNIDTRDLLGFMQSLENAMQYAYKAEESTRLSGQFYERLLKANEEFYRLVAEADLSKDEKLVFEQETQFEKMEGHLASREEGVEQGVKSLFISALNNIRNSIGVTMQHIAYLSNNVDFMSQIKKYTIDVLTSVMQKITERKLEFGGKFAEEAQRYQDTLNRVRESANIAKGQIPIISRLAA